MQIRWQTRTQKKGLIKELEAENRRLEEALEQEKLRAKAYDTMINLAEKTFNIPIRKKSGTKQ